MSPAGRRQLASLRRLARLYEVETSFIGADGKGVEAAPETVLAVLQALGAEATGFEELDAAYHTRLLAIWGRQLDPVAVAWGGGPAVALLRLPDAEVTRHFDCTLHLESGELRRWRWESDASRLRRGPDIEGVRYYEAPIDLPAGLPYGYHHLELQGGGEALQAEVIAAPLRAYSPGNSGRRDWGVFLPLYALHSRLSQGIGDVSDLKRFAAWARSRGASFVGTLPLLASFLDQPFDPSPYAPVSRLFWNEVFIDTDGSTSPAGESRFVDYRGTMQAKRKALTAAAAAFFAKGASDEYRAFLARRPEVDDYASYRAAQERLGANWRAWPESQRAGKLSEADYDRDAALFYRYAQWQANRQMQGLAAGSDNGAQIYLDLPVGVHPDGYDAWRHQDIFATGISVGAPPDPLTSTGQDWGFAPLLPDRLRASGYRYVAAYLRHNLSLGGLLRIDHVFGLHRLYWLPHGTSAREGVYVRYRSDELFAVLCLESHRAGTGVIGEDIGITPPGFRRRMKRHGIGRLYVLSGSIAFSDAHPIVPIPEGATASFGTHDKAPFAGFWQVEDLDARARLGVLDLEGIAAARERRRVEKETLATHLKAIGLLTEPYDTMDVMRATQALLARSGAGRVMLNLEDLWLETESQNVPGTTVDRHPNWSRRARLSLEQIQADPDVQQVMALVATERPGQPRRRTRKSGPE